MKIIPSIVTFLFLIAAGTVSSPAQNATTVEPLLVYKALQDKDCRHWVDSVMDKLSFKEKVGQLFIYTIAPVDTKRNLELLREVIDTYKVGGLLFSGGKMQNHSGHRLQLHVRHGNAGGCLHHPLCSRSRLVADSRRCQFKCGDCGRLCGNGHHIYGRLNGWRCGWRSDRRGRNDGKINGQIT